MSLISNSPKGNVHEDQDLPDQRICRLLLDNPIAKTLGAVALAVQLVLPPLALEGTLNKSERLGVSLIAYFVDGAAERSGEFLGALRRGFEKGLLNSGDERAIKALEFLKK